ncbi:elongation factor EF-2 [Candidatus Woesearchaeota archaeon]|nr:elongation factor EF-2 [Candidatus Woesearchaeota archaeon]
MADNLAEKVTRLMQYPERIRNICTCAHIDHGKCISGDSRIVLGNGTIVNAQKLFDLAENKGIRFEETNDHVIYDTGKLGLNVFSLNKGTGKTEIKPISLAWKLKGGTLIRVKLRNGFTVATTPEHKFIVYNNLDFVEKEASEIKLGDRVVCSRNLNTESDLNIKQGILLKLKDKRFYAILKEEFGKKIKNGILNLGIKEVCRQINTGLKHKSLYHGALKNRYLLKDLLEISQLFNIGLEEVYDNINSMVFRNGAQRGKNSNSIKLPQNFKNFYYLTGLLFGDGSNKKFIVGKPELGKKFVDLCNEVGIEVTFRNYSNRTPEIVANLTLIELLNSLFDYPIKGKKSHNIRVSDFLMKSPKEYSSMFLRGYFDTDGSVEKSRSAITITSASNQMIKDLSLFLLKFGCIPIIEIDNTISLSGLSLVNFVKEIGFGLEGKSLKAQLKAERIVGSQVSDLVAVENNGLTRNFNLSSDKIVRFCKQRNISLEKLNKVLNGDIAFIEVKSLETINEEFVYDFTVPENHNFVAEGMFIHNTTFSDNLLAGAGMISEELAGKQLVLDFHEDEIARGITIDAANVSMIHELDGEEYLINLIDTPGHVDFGGDVTRAMRAIDGAIVLVCAVEGIMPQTETVLRQALKELVKPVLFINKVDRLIKEVKLTPEQMQERFMKVITNVNNFIRNIAPQEYKDKWGVNVADGSVAFGSAFHKWALSVPYMKKTGITFKDVIDAYTNDTYKELAKKAPLHNIILNMSVHHHPNPKQAQIYRIPKIWHGELESEVGQALVNCDPNGPVAFVVTKIVIDKHAGEVAAGRLFSGTVRQGQDLYLNGAKKEVRLQQVSIYKGAQRISVDEAYPGNIVGLVGLKNTFAGETVSTSPIEQFEAIKHIFEPVVTKSIDAKSPADLPRLVEVLKQVNKEDPSIVIKINEETGENLISGMGELHLEVIENRIKTEKHLEVVTSNPIVVYRETVLKKSQEIEGKSPNKHNKFYFSVEPLNENIYSEIKAGNIPEMRIKKKDMETFKKFEALGMSMKAARNIQEAYRGNLLVDDTRGIVHIGEVIEMVMDGFEEVMENGVLAREPCVKMNVILNDCKLHEDAIHRGPAQVLPAIRDAIRMAMLDGKAVLYEPMQIMQIEAPGSYMGDLSKLISNKRGQLLSMEQEGDRIVVMAKLPVAEMFGLASDLRSATGGRGSYFISDQVFEKLPELLQQKVITQIRTRKGLKLVETPETE